MEKGKSEEELEVIIEDNARGANERFNNYLKASGLEMSWLGSGRMIMSFNFTEEEFDEVTNRFVEAALAMKNDGWWWQAAASAEQLTNKKIKRQFLYDMLSNLFPVLPKVVSPPIKSIALDTKENNQINTVSNHKTADITPIKEPLDNTPEIKNTTIKKVS